MRRTLLHTLCVALAGCLFSAVAFAAAPVGTISALTGSATVQRADGAPAPAAKGTPVANGDTVTTGPRSLLAIEFEDGTRFVLGAVSTLRIDRVERGDTPLFSAEVLRGAFRFVTGLIARDRPGAMSVRAGVVATIGIRGTTVGGEVGAESATIVLLEPEGDAHASVVEVANEFGKVLLTEHGTGTRIPDARSPPSPPARMRLRTVDNMLRSLGNVQRLTMPRPGPP